jgi:glutathione S-transferase
VTQFRLWGQPKSINVQKVVWALDELGLQYERIDAGGPFGRVKDADYLSLNPNGLVPALEVDGVTLWESNAVLRYLFNTHGSAPLHPSDPIQRARADQWTEWYGSSYWPTRACYSSNSYARPKRSATRTSSPLHALKCSTLRES